MSLSWSPAVFCVLVLAAAMTGGYYRPGTWYRELDKPAWTPPDLLFPIAWFILYAMMAVAAWLVYEIAGLTGGAVALSLWAIQLIFNALWSYFFFGLRRMNLALYDVAALWIMILATIIAFWMITPLAGALMLPYLAWVSFAAFLNWTLLQRNPEAGAA
ncbi:MAG: TspO/MBR family protein [Cohaesibacteraceae bacterium]